MNGKKDTVVQLGLAKDEPNQVVIDAMRYWLERAEKGELQAVILLGTTKAGGHLRGAAGGMGDANAVYLATLVIHDGVEDARLRETHYEPEPPDGEKV